MSVAFTVQPPQRIQAALGKPHCAPLCGGALNPAPSQAAITPLALADNAVGGGRSLEPIKDQAYRLRLRKKRMARVMSTDKALTSPNHTKADPKTQIKEPDTPLGRPLKAPPKVAHHMNSPGDATASASETSACGRVSAAALY